jgi:hypothetical protein
MRISLRDDVALRWPSCGDYSARWPQPSKQRVAGSNPAGRARPEPQLKAHIARPTSGAHEALPRRRARCVPDGLVSDRPSSAAEAEGAGR